MIKSEAYPSSELIENTPEDGAHNIYAIES